VAYLIQTPNKIDPYFYQFISENADLYVLSWLNFDNSWEYHFDGRGICGVEGINVLLGKALEKGPYRYFILVDDDVRLEYVKGQSSTSGTTPIRSFERFLKEKEPAVCGIANPQIGSHVSSKDGVCSSIHYLDGQVIAYHIETLGYGGVLPASLFAIDQSWQYFGALRMATTTAFYRNHKFQYNKVYIKPTQQVRQNYVTGGTLYVRNHGRGTKYGDFIEYTDNYVKPALGPTMSADIPPWHSCDPVGEKLDKQGTYYYSYDRLKSLGINLDHDILCSTAREWRKIKPPWWDETMKQSGAFYAKHSQGGFWND